MDMAAPTGHKRNRDQHFISYLKEGSNLDTTETLFQREEPSLIRIGFHSDNSSASQPYTLSSVDETKLDSAMVIKCLCTEMQCWVSAPSPWPHTRPSALRFLEEGDPTAPADG